MSGHVSLELKMVFLSSPKVAGVSCCVVCCCGVCVRKNCTNGFFFFEKRDPLFR